MGEGCVPECLIPNPIMSNPIMSRGVPKCLINYHLLRASDLDRLTGFDRYSHFVRHYGIRHIHLGLIRGEDQHISVHYFWRLSHDCHVIAFLCSMLTSWHSLSAKASIVTLPWTYLTDCFSCNSNSHLFHYFSWASLSRAVSTVAAFLHFTMLCTVPNQSLHLTVIQVISLSLILSYEIFNLFIGAHLLRSKKHQRSRVKADISGHAPLLLLRKQAHDKRHCRIIACANNKG